MQPVAPPEGWSLPGLWGAGAAVGQSPQHQRAASAEPGKGKGRSGQDLLLEEAASAGAIPVLAQWGHGSRADPGDVSWLRPRSCSCRRSPPGPALPWLVSKGPCHRCVYSPASVANFKQTLMGTQVLKLLSSSTFRARRSPAGRGRRASDRFLGSGGRHRAKEKQNFLLNIRPWQSALRPASPCPLQLRGGCHLWFLGRGQPRRGEAAGALGALPAPTHAAWTCNAGGCKSVLLGAFTKACVTPWPARPTGTPGRRALKFPTGPGDG